MSCSTELSMKKFYNLGASILLKAEAFALHSKHFSNKHAEHTCKHLWALFHLLIVAINPKDVVRRKAWEEKLYNYRTKWSQHPVEKVKDDKVNRYDNDDIINHLTYPINRLPPAHAKKCDARYGLL